jgi:hypothetical protein
MRAIVFLAFVVLILALIGWISFSKDAERSSINLETQEIKEDTQKAMDSGAQLLEKAGQRIERATTSEPEKQDASKSPAGTVDKGP